MLSLLAFVLKVAERVIGQILLIAQGFGQILHRLLARGLRAVATLALGDAQVLHQLVQLLHQLCSFGHPAFFHQFLNPVHQRLKLVHAHLLTLLAAVGLIGAVTAGLGLFRQHPQIVVGRLAQFLHQFGDFLVRGAVAHGLCQPLLRAPQPFARVGQTPVFQLHRQFPQRIHNLGLALFGQAEFRHAVQTPCDRPHPQIDRLAGKEPFGAVGHSLQDLHDTRRILVRPHQVAPLFDDSARQGLKEPPARQDDLFHRALRRLSRRIGDLQLDRHRQVRQRVLAQIVDQQVLEIRPVAVERHGQIQHQWRNRIGIDRQPVPPVDGCQIQRDGRLPALDPVIVRGREGLRQLSHRVGLDRAGERDAGRRIGDGCDGPCGFGRAGNGQIAGLRDREHLLRVRGGGHLSCTARDGFGHGERTHLAVKPQCDGAAFRHTQRACGDIIEIDRRLARIGRRFDPAFPDRTRGKGLLATSDHITDRSHPQKRAEQECCHEKQKRDEPQTVWVAVGNPQVGLYRTGGFGPFRHARDMGAPDRL